MRKDAVFRLFVSSTFSDFVAERSVLQTEVFTRVRDHCAQRGARFQAVDLRWGVTHEAALDQRTLPLCLDELRRCRGVSPGANFIVLLGDRYGWRPLPAAVEARELEALAARCTAGDRSELARWFQRDDNAVPPEYVLQARTGESVDPVYWARLEERLRGLLARAAAVELTAGDPRSAKYEESATHQEIRHGVLEPPDAARHVRCYLRTIQGLPSDETAVAYRDLCPSDGRPADVTGWVVDSDAAARLDALRVELKRVLPKAHIHEYRAEWGERGPRLDLAAFAARVEADLLEMVDAELRTLHRETATEREERVTREFAEERAAHFHGRRRGLDRIRDYLGDAKDREPLIVTGPPGSGKTAVLARAWLNVKEGGNGVRTLARFIGATPESSDLRSLLSGLCLELGAGPVGSEHLPAESVALARELDARMRAASEESPLLVFIDAVEQLNPADDAHSLHWLPAGELPAGAKLVVSVGQAEEVADQCAEILRRRYPDRFLHLAPLERGDGAAILEAWLADRGRTLQPLQVEEVLSRFADCPYPLYLKLAFEKVCRWRSNDRLPRDEIGADVPALLADLFRRLEQGHDHGPTLPGRSLRYLAAARRGLAEDELIQVLSDDAEVMADFRRRSPDSPNVSQLPFVTWSRLYADLEPYLTERAFDGARLLSFYHGNLRQAVEAAYLGTTSSRAAASEGLARFFERQPLTLGAAHEDPPSLDARRAAVNRRLVDELPWQLAEASRGGDGNAPARLERLLTDLEFVDAKCLAGKVHDLSADYALAQTVCGERRTTVSASVVPPSGGADRLEEHHAFLSANAHLIESHPGAAIPIARGVRLVSVAEPADRLLRQRRDVWIAEEPALNRAAKSHARVRSLPGGASGVAMDARGRTAVAAAGRGQSIHFWNLTTGEPVHIRGSRDAVDRVALTPDGRVAVTSGGTMQLFMRPGTVDGLNVLSGLIEATGRPIQVEPDYAIRVWDVASGDCVADLHGHDDQVMGLAVSADGATVVSVSHDGSLRTWNVQTQACGAVVRNNLGSVRSLAVDAAAQICVMVCGQGRIHVWHVPTKHWRVLRPPQGREFLAADITPDGRALCALTDHSIGLWRLDTIPKAAGGPLRLVSGPIVGAWSLVSHEPIRTLETPEELRGCVRVSADGLTAIAAAKEHALVVWRTDELNHVGRATRIPLDSSAESLAITANADHALCGGSGLHLFDLRERTSPAEVLPSREGRLEVRATSNSGSQLVRSAFGEEKHGLAVLRSKETQDGRWSPELVPLGSGTEESAHGCFCAKGRLVVTADAEGNAVVWRADTGTEARRIRLEPGKRAALAAASDAEVIVTAGEDRKIRVWDLRDGTRLHELAGHEGEIECVAVTPDGRIAASGGGDYSLVGTEKGGYDLHVWDLIRGEQLHALQGHVNRINDIAVDHRGWGAASVCSGLSSGLLRFWDIERGLRRGAQLIAPVILHGPIVRNLCLAPDGATAIVGAFNNEMRTVQVFHAISGRVHVLPESDRQLFANVALVRSGRVVVGEAWGSGQVRVWDFATLELLASHPRPPSIKRGQFAWVDTPSGICACPAEGGGLCTFDIRNLPPREMTIADVIAQLSANAFRRRLTALWYASEHLELVSASYGDSRRYFAAILENVCLPDEGDPDRAALRHAAVVAARAAGAAIVPAALKRLASERDWQAVAGLALVVGASDLELADPLVRRAIEGSAAHSDVRTRKHVALLLRPSRGRIARALLKEVCDADPSVAEFVSRVAAGVADEAELRQDPALPRFHEDLSTILCPSSPSELKQSNAHWAGLQRTAKLGKVTRPGSSHPFLESLLRQTAMRRAAKEQRFDIARALRDDIHYINAAHDFEIDETAETIALFKDLARLQCVALPVKRVIGGIVGAAKNDDRKRESVRNFQKCVDLLEEVWEPIGNIRAQFRWLCNHLDVLDDPTELFRELGVTEALEETDGGLGAWEWLVYAGHLQDGGPGFVYCLANSVVQKYPTQDEADQLIKVLFQLDLAVQARALRRSYAPEE